MQAFCDIVSNSIIGLFCGWCIAKQSDKMSVNGTSSLLDGTIGVGDAVLIEPLNEDNFLENIQLRFNHDNIYVSDNTVFLVPVCFVVWAYLVLFNYCCYLLPVLCSSSISDEVS